MLIAVPHGLMFLPRGVPSCSRSSPLERHRTLAISHPTQPNRLLLIAQNQLKEEMEYTTSQKSNMPVKQSPTKHSLIRILHSSSCLASAFLAFFFPLPLPFFALRSLKKDLRILDLILRSSSFARSNFLFFSTVWSLQVRRHFGSSNWG